MSKVAGQIPPSRFIKWKRNEEDDWIFLEVSSSAFEKVIKEKSSKGYIWEEIPESQYPHKNR